jgi:GTP-binding protein
VVVSNFVDESAICVKGGDGGAGCVSFRREAHVSRGGPDGGDGGKGGDVWFVADHNVSSLLAFRDHPHRRGANGTHGKGKKQHGATGDDIDVRMPVGTVVKDEAGMVVADLADDGDRWLASPGGKGGHGNARFLSNKRRAPSFAEQGEAVLEQWLQLELKLMADVALVGFPNVGKSTLISRISAAKPKIGDYPFTTLEPNLGVVNLSERDEQFEMVVADVPGLIEGAAEGRGLGHQFLRHIERARCLAVLVDLSETDGVDWAEQQRVLLDELGNYEPELLERPRLLVGSKVDLVGDGPDDFDGVVISAVTGSGIPPLLGAMRAIVEAARTAEPETEGYVVHRPVPDGVSVRRGMDGSWEVEGREAVRAVMLSDLTNPEALDHARERLTALGVDRKLERAGARTGDGVRIGTFEFEYESDDELVVDGTDDEWEPGASARRGPSRGTSPR